MIFNLVGLEARHYHQELRCAFPRAFHAPTKTLARLLNTRRTICPNETAHQSTACSAWPAYCAYTSKYAAATGIFSLVQTKNKTKRSKKTAWKAEKLNTPSVLSRRCCRGAWLTSRDYHSKYSYRMRHQETARPPTPAHPAPLLFPSIRAHGRTWVVRESLPEVANTTVPRLLDVTTGSSFKDFERYCACTAGSPLMPNCATKPCSTLKNRQSSKKPSADSDRKRSAPMGAHSATSERVCGRNGGDRG